VADLDLSGALLVVPPVVFVVTRRVCSELKEREWTEIQPMQVARE
jgi:hypothetical protein